MGDRLITKPYSENETSLPSPNQLRYRIILKNKKLRNPATGLGSGLSRSLYRTSTIDDPTNGSTFPQVLTSTTNTEMEDEDDSDEEYDDDEIQGQ